MVMEYKSIIGVAGPLMVVDKVRDVMYNEVVEIETATGERKTGQVLDAMLDKAVVQVFEGTSNLDTRDTKAKFLGETMKIAVSTDMLGRIFDGAGRPKDGCPDSPGRPVGHKRIPDEPAAREFPRSSSRQASHP